MSTRIYLNKEGERDILMYSQGTGKSSKTLALIAMQLSPVVNRKIVMPVDQAKINEEEIKRTELSFSDKEIPEEFRLNNKKKQKGLIIQAIRGLYNIESVYGQTVLMNVDTVDSPNTNLGQTPAYTEKRVKKPIEATKSKVSTPIEPISRVSETTAPVSQNEEPENSVSALLSVMLPVDKNPISNPYSSEMASQIASSPAHQAPTVDDDEDLKRRKAEAIKENIKRNGVGNKKKTELEIDVEEAADLVKRAQSGEKLTIADIGRNLEKQLEHRLNL